MQLNILADGDVGNSVGVAAGEFGDGAQLAGAEQAVGDSNSHHEALQRPAFSALAAGYARSVTLGVDAPPAKVGAEPFRRNGAEPFAGEAPNFLQAFPRILGAFQALDSLCLGFCRCVCHRSLAPPFCPQKIKTHRQNDLAVGYKCRYFKRSIKSATSPRQGTHMHNNNSHAHRAEILL